MGKYNVKRKEDFVVVPGREALPEFAKPPTSSPLRLLKEAQPEWRSLTLAIVSLFAASGANLAIPALFGSLIDSFDKDAESSEAFTRTVLLLVVVSVVNAVFSFLKSLFFERAGERMVARLRNRVFQKVLEFEIGFFDQSRSAALVSNVQGDSTVIKEACTSNIATALRNILQLVGGVAYLISVSWKLTLLLVVVIFPVSLLTRIYAKRIKGISKDARQSLAEAADVAEESFSSIRTVRSFAAEDKQRRLYEDKTAQALALGIKAALANGLFSGGTSAVISLSFIAVVFVGGRLVLSGELSTGGLTSFLLYGMTLGGAVAALGGVWGSLASAMGATERIYSLLDRLPLVERDEGAHVDRNSLKGSIVFENVCFSYPSRPSESVLKGVSFEIEAGSTVAFVSESGQGKSTILSLVEKFYVPSSGRILIDGKDLAEISGSSLRRNIGLVLQDCALFATTLRENIAFGAPDPESVSEERIIAAAKAANAWKFITGFQKGLDTVVGERGQRLSGGQRQRIAIARCFLIDPRFQFLDEASSSLDANAEAEVQAALTRLTKKGSGRDRLPKTTIIVAHRLSSIRHCDRIFVLDKGVIVASGRHEELLESCEVYSELVKKQITAAETLGNGGGAGTPSAVRDAAAELDVNDDEEEDEHEGGERDEAVAIDIDVAAGLPAAQSSRPTATLNGLGDGNDNGDDNDEADNAALLRVADTLAATKSKAKVTTATRQ